MHVLHQKSVFGILLLAKLPGFIVLLLAALIIHLFRSYKYQLLSLL
jgi:hypothetical protein